MSYALRNTAVWSRGEVGGVKEVELEPAENQELHPGEGGVLEKHV